MCDATFMSKWNPLMCNLISVWIWLFCKGLKGLLENITQSIIKNNEQMSQEKCSGEV